jgi:organic radical activating enzyme
MTEHDYWINEIFLSPQGEGGRAGEMSVFVRFTGCNLRCSMEPGPRSPGGFDCDTEFESGRPFKLPELIRAIEDVDAPHSCGWVVLTGGEPSLQVNAALVAALHAAKYKIAIETNGMRILPRGIDWITVSPKMAEHTLRQLQATEVKYVRHAGQGIPRPHVQADLKWLSPAYGANGRVDPEALKTCLDLVREHPEWRLSEQQHKHWGVR